MGFGHVELAESTSSATGAVARELVPAEQVSADEWLIVGTPGLVNGCAAGDRIHVNADGTFEVLVRGGNVAAHIYARNALPDAALVGLRQVFASLGGTVEWPATKGFVVVTVPVAAGFQSIEEPIESFASLNSDTEWNFGNVYDEADTPLNWWM